MAFLTEAANRGSISTGYDIDNSVKLEQPERLQRGYDGTGNIASITATDRKKTTLSYWVKRTQLNASGNGIVFIMYAGNTIMLGFENDKLRVSTSYGYSLKSNANFRDTSAWYHLVFSIDTTQATANNRAKAYVNGAEVTSWGTQTITISQNANNGMFNEVNGSHYFGWSDSQATGCYVAEAHCIDGQALTASDFGEYDTNGIWVPIEYTGTYGNQGYYLDFENASALGEDQSGNGNDFGTFYGGDSSNQATDTPTNNFCIMNAIRGADRMPLMSEGATVIGNNVNDYRYSEGTMGVANGKWYWEMKPTVDGNTLVSGAGIASNPLVGFYQTTGNFVYHYDGYRYVNGGATGYGTAWATNDIIGFAYDADNWTLTCYLNNSSQGNLLASQADISAETFLPYTYSFGTHTYQWNFGGYTSISNTHTNTDANGYGSFVYAPPSGYYALCTKNLAEFG